MGQSGWEDGFYLDAGIIYAGIDAYGGTSTEYLLQHLFCAIKSAVNAVNNRQSGCYFHFLGV